MWGLSPKNVNWLFEAVVKPIHFYEASVWWRALEVPSNVYNSGPFLCTAIRLNVGQK